MSRKWLFLISILLVGKMAFANIIIPAPKKIITDRFIVNWKPNLTIFNLDYSPLLERYPISSRAITLVRKLPIHFNQDPSSIRINIKLKGQNLHFDDEMKAILPDSLQGKKEGYLLSIMKNEILIYGFDQAGLLYAVQSLRQLISAFTSGQALRIQTIIDYPSFDFRGVMDDISRGPLSNLAFMKEQIDRFSLLKINVVSYYIEHVLKTEKHFAYAPLDALTIDELMELREYADSFNIKIMGSFQSLGHFKEILAHPNYQNLGASERMIQPADAASLQFLFDNYDELMPVSSGEVFNINCDEAYDLDRGPALHDLTAQIGKGGVYYNHIYPLLQHVQKFGKVPGLWGDMLLQYPEIIKNLPPQTVVFTWNYLDQDDYLPYISPFADQDISFIVTPGIVNSNRLWPDFKEVKNNISKFSYQGWENGAKGVLTTVWDDGGRHFFTCDWYGVAIGAEHSWNPQQQDVTQFAEHFYQIFYQGHSRSFDNFLEDLQAFQKTKRLQTLDNSLVELSLNIEASHGYIDTTELSKIIQLCDQAEKDIFNIAREISSEALFPANDFNYWLFKIQELREAILGAMSICNINELRTDTRISEKQSTQQIKEIAEERRQKSEEMLDLFKILWYKENRDYSFFKLKKVYDQRVAFWKDIANLSGSANVSSIPVYQATDDKYFTYWLGAGPSELGSKQNIKTDFFKGLGGEQKIRPSAIDFYENKTGNFESWKKIIGDRPDYVDLNSFYTTPDLKVLYTNCQIYADLDLTVSYELRFAGQHQIIFNGIVLDHQLQDEPGISDGEINLRKGRNDLLVKFLSNNSGDNQFMFFLPGQSVNSVKYRYYVHEPK
ncbi:MAG: family 20 glycosylhydrolase [Saprospiraceae bacterium]|nr:family 20 glycosylhydrolase [Saprospiraceae bacterium]